MVGPQNFSLRTVCEFQLVQIDFSQPNREFRFETLKKELCPPMIKVETILATIGAHAGFAITFIPFARTCCRIWVMYICDAFIINIDRLAKCLRMVIIGAVFQIALCSMISYEE